MHPMNMQMYVAPILAVLLSVWSIFVTIFFMVCAWRAMIAHEKIAEAQTKRIQKTG